MGAAAATMTLGEAIGIVQQWHSYNQDQLWSKRGYDIGLQSMRIDILNTVREEMRDQVTVIISSLDNLMVVATLMLSIGFGFVVEGTFPPAEKEYDYDDLERQMLILYAVLAALSLVFPLACMMLTIAARFEVELCQQDVMGDLQKHLLKALQRDQHDADLVQGLPSSSRSDDEEVLHRADSSSRLGLPTARRPKLRRNSRSEPLLGARKGSQGFVKGIREAVKGGMKRQLSNFEALFFEENVGHIAEDEVRLLAEGLLQKVNYYHFLYPIAQLFLWCGMLSSVLVCCVLLGLYYKANYPETPWMWRSYSGILGSCALGCIFFFFWIKFRLRTKQIQVRQKSNDIVAKTISGIYREDSGITPSTLFANAQPVFGSDAEVEAAYRDAFGRPTQGSQETDYESAEEFHPPYANRRGSKAAEALALAASYN